MQYSIYGYKSSNVLYSRQHNSVPVDRIKLNKKKIETPNFVQRCIFVCWTTFYYYLYLKKCHFRSQKLPFFLQLAEKCRILPPLLNRILWMLLCIGKNISEASSHLQLLPDLLERVVCFAQLFWASEKSFTPGGILADDCMGLVQKRHTHLYACQTKAFVLGCWNFISSIQKYPSFQRHQPQGRSFPQTKDMYVETLEPHRVGDCTNTFANPSLVQTVQKTSETQARACTLGWIKFLETIASHGTCSECVETLQKWQ